MVVVTIFIAMGLAVLAATKLISVDTLVLGGILTLILQVLVKVALILK